MSNRSVLLSAIGILVVGFLLGRATSSDTLLSSSNASGPKVATFSGGSLRADDVRDAIAGLSDAGQRRAAVEQLVKARLLAGRAEDAERHLTPEFLRRYSEELARLEIDKSFEEPFQKQIPLNDELEKFFAEHKTTLGRPERVRLAHVAFLAPASDTIARALKRKEADKALGTALRANDEYALGRLALTLSDDQQSRPAAGELPFLTREEVVTRLGPEVAEVAFTAAAGFVVSRVIETAAGFQIVKVLSREEGREARYDELRDAIKARISSERREKAFKEFMDGVWSSGHVKIDEKALEEVGREKGGGDGGARKQAANAK